MPFVCPHRPLHRLTVAVAAFFGLATIVAGGTVLLGLRDAGYEVVRPVLWFNALMGVAYVATAILIARDLERGWMASIAVAAANVAVLLGIVVLSASGGTVAPETMAAMSVRAAVWVAIVLALSRERRVFAAAG